MISSNFSHSKRFDGNKFWCQKFKSAYLHQYSMELHDSTCIVIYELRPIKAISRLQELARSNLTLMEMQLLNLLDSRLESVKQLIYDAWMKVWNQCFSSQPLESARISNCHLREQCSTATISSRFSTFCLQQMSNYACR